MNKRLFPRMAFCLTLITSFLFMPLSAVYADGLTQDSEYWKWWYIENTTDAITDGDGASADNLTDTYNGSTVGQYVYDQTGLTAEDVKDYVQQQYENATGYVEHTAEWYSSAIDDIWNSSIDVGTKAKYQAEKALRETVDTAGNTVVNVSSSGYWNNVYNDLFNSGSYNDQYEQVGGNNSWAGTNTSGAVTVSYMFLGGYAPNKTIIPSYGIYSTLEGTQDCIKSEQQPSTEGYGGHCVFSVSVNGQRGYYIARDMWAWTESRNITYQYENNVVIVSGECYDDGTPVGSGRMWSYRIIFDSNFTSGGTESIPVLQPKQVGFVVHNGIKYPVYTDPSLNPYKVNDNGTVTWLDGSGDEPIYVDPSEITDDGSLDILNWLDNDDLTQNPYNPFGKPWNTNDDGSALGGFFSNLIKDIGSVFEGLSKLIESLIDKIIKAIKDIANIIVDALKSFWNLLIGDIEDYSDLFETDVDDNFGMISDLYDLLLECMGVDA